MSPDSRLSQSIESKRLFAVSKSASLYRHTFLALALSGLLVFHLKEHCIPLWSDVPKGGITLHDDKREVSDTRAKSIRGVTLGTCMGVFLNCLSKRETIQYIAQMREKGVGRIFKINIEIP